MTIDIERLKHDETLWPEGATHVGSDTRDGVCFYKLHKDGFKFLYAKKRHPPWWKEVVGLPVHGPLIPRPEPQAAEWDGEGLPPVGELVELKVFQAREEVWRTAEVVGYWEGAVVMVDLAVNVAVKEKKPNYRPIRIKEQRLRDELADLINKNGMCLSGELANKILSHYTLEPKQ